MCDRGPELKFSSINNIYSLSFTISKQWESGMNALDIADIQLWWTEWRLSALALPYWVVYFWLIVCCQASKLLKWLISKKPFFSELQKQSHSMSSYSWSNSKWVNGLWTKSLYTHPVLITSLFLCNGPLDLKNKQLKALHTWDPPCL